MAAAFEIESGSRYCFILFSDKPDNNPVVYDDYHRSDRPGNPVRQTGTLFTGWTFERNKDWSDEITLYRDCVEKAPGKARPYNNLGYALSRQGNPDAAVQLFSRAPVLDPQHAGAHNNLDMSRHGLIWKKPING